jgi:hypothetical protein
LGYGQVDAAPGAGKSETNGGPTPQKSEQAAPAPPEKSTPANVHAWIADRIRALQEEQQGRWQKVVNFVLGH